MPLGNDKNTKIKAHHFIVHGVLPLAISLINAQGQPADSLVQSQIRAVSASYYVEAGSYGTKRENDAPDYARHFTSMAETSRPFYNGIILGWDSRMRTEFRYNDLRRPESSNRDFPFLLRQRAYLGMVKALDPFRFALEVEDARINNGKYPKTNRDVNEFDLIQGYGELYFDNAFGIDAKGNNRPFSVRYGLMAFEFLDRRLIARNNWRNTTNTFTGLRLVLGADGNDWQLDALVVRPVNRIVDQLDRRDKDRWFFAVMGHWRKWSEVVTIEPYYIGLKQNASAVNNSVPREIHGFGLRLYGRINNSGFNYDVTGMYQLGQDNDRQQLAHAFTSEIGYTLLSSQMKPRFSAFFGYASGDKDPNDTKNNRFERFFGFARPWSSDDYMVMENIVTPKVKVEWQAKIRKIHFRFDGGYSFYWLASPKDRFNNLLNGSSFNRDPLGDSGTFLGHGLDFRTRFNPTAFINLNLGYTYYTMGNFVTNRQLAANGENATDSNFFYVELSLNFLDLIKQIDLKSNKDNLVFQ